MVPLYILGLLLRFGPQHGYQIKKTISEQLADFTQIKLPTIYYHLEKMLAEGLLTEESEKPGSRPEKTVYSVTPKGEAAFLTLLHGLLQFEFRPSFSEDGAFYFSEYLKQEELASSLKKHISDLEKATENLEKHRAKTLMWLEGESRTMADIIFDHHARHYRAQLEWAREALQKLA